MRFSKAIAFLSALVIVLLLGAAQLWFPFEGDQAFFLHTAQLLRSGNILYHDVWDIKQPGIFLFYMAAGELFGYDIRGVHLLEMGWMALTCGAAAWWAAAMGLSSRALFLAPLFTVGAYYAAAWAWHLTQIEALVGLPLMLAGGLALSSREASSPRLLAAGVAGGVVLVFKTVLGPVVIAMWVAAALFATAASGSARWRTFFRIALLLAAGCIIPVVIVSVWAYHNNILSDLVRVTFEFPFRFTLSESSEHFYPSLRSAQYFFHMVYWFGIRFGPLLVVSVIGARYLLKRRDAYGAVLAAWLMAATLIIGVQTWWEYQLFLLLPPVGLLAAAGIDWIMILPKSGKRTGLMVGSLVAISVALGIPLAEKAVALLRYGPVLSGPARLSYQSELFPLWGSIVQNVGFLSDPDALPGPIYVYDGPLYWLASGRELIKVPDHAYQLPEQRQHWPADIMRADPAYIRLPKEIRESFNRIDPSFQDLLDKRYRRLAGRPPWYIRKQSEW